MRNHRAAIVSRLAFLSVVLSVVLIGFGIARGAPESSRKQAASSPAAQQSTSSQETTPSEPARRTLLIEQSQAEMDAKSAGCLSCHTKTDSPTMHETGTVRLGCVDCHLGDASVSTQARPGTAA
jgi:nitrate/TMAO reductase-like tetraheme cytochrome c subunit